MCKNCECEKTPKKIQYKCNCKEDDCACDQVISFDKEPGAEPHCCGVPMKRLQ